MEALARTTLLAVVLAALAGVSPARAASVELTPATAAPGATLTFVGHGFRPAGAVTIALDGRRIGRARADGRGEVRVRAAVPAGARSGRLELVTIGAGREQVVNVLQVGVAAPTTEHANSAGARVLLTPAAGPPGSPVQVRGRGLRPRARVRVTLAGARFAALRASRRGGFSHRLELPPGLVGDQRLVVQSGRTALGLTFRVTAPDIAPEPPSAPGAATPAEPATPPEPGGTGAPPGGSPPPGEPAPVGDVTPPAVTLTEPAAGGTTTDPTPILAGNAGAAAGDASSVLVRIFSGSAAAGTPARTVTVPRTGTGWSAIPLSPLADGTYTAEAQQSDAAGNVGRSAPRTFDVLGAPAVSIVSPGPGHWTAGSDVTFGGAAGNAPGDAATVTLSVGGGETTVTRTGATWAATVSGLTPGAHTAQARQTDADGITGRSNEVTVFVATAGESPVVLAAGDMASCASGGDEATAAVLAGTPKATVLTLGDNAYETGAPREFRDCYQPSWGQERHRTRPSPGNHEYGRPGASGYYDYFGPAAGDPAKGYYSYDLGGWHVVALNSNCAAVGGCGAGSPQHAFLANDLAANPAACTLAYWHHARFSTGEHGDDASAAALFQLLYDAGADLVLVGHDHDYERFAPLSPAGAADVVNGIRQIVVGTGGRSLRGFDSFSPATEVRDASTAGVLRLTLDPTAYSWQFLAAGTGTFTDAGSASCH